MATTSAPPPLRRRTPGLAVPLARFVVCFLLLPNLVFWLVAPRMGIVVPGLFNLDAIALGLLALFVRPRWIVALFALDLLLEVVYGIHATFGSGYVEIGLSVRYLFSIISVRFLLTAGLAAVATVGLLGWAWTRWRPRVTGRRRWQLVAIVLAVTAALALWTRQRLTPAGANLAVSPLLSPVLGLLRAWQREDVSGWLGGHYIPTEPAASASAHVLPGLVGLPAHRPRPDFVLVLVESWGWAHNPVLRQVLEAPFHSPALAARYRLQSGTVAFSGTTSAGELRELCQYRLVYSKAPLAISPTDFGKCIPWRFDAAGYDTLAVDTASQFWPGGTHWYRRMGLRQVISYPEFHALGLSTFYAGPIRSIADPEVAEWLGSLLARPNSSGKPRMIFWLTISAHLPINLPLPPGYAADCSLAPVTAQDAQACGWYRIERKTLAAIAALAAQPGLAPTVFVVVGDHAPPFTGAARGAFSSRQVPYLRLTPQPESPGSGAKRLQ